MGEILYKYTTLESLALILKSKKIRLNPLTKMDDLQEAQSSDKFEYGKYVFISSWMDQSSESIAMWKLYANMHSGVRIGLRKNPFKKYSVTKFELQKKYPNIKMEEDFIDLIAPMEECFNDDYFILNFLYEQSLEKVEYTDDDNFLKPTLFLINEDGIELKSARLGRYKNTYWEFQNEERYVLRFIPIDVKKINTEINAAQMVYNKFLNNKTFLTYYDLELTDEAYDSMEITLSPQFSNGNKVLLESLQEKYNPNLKIFESVLKNRIKL